ncbi:Cof-type HAD-IIB family hydrolase [Pseudalkalibacillus berkeleyi]|uniref:Cof-type HAD-IIB family hydrolase n=1 Tax=Pseudalkalibacillus berkeleyi TaxID=1069813 RepID=A0ABS9GX70_9BACL|nr:Cof-type HAD-IIB family hydrolase [Pseudalkalibacillus berkeleyi]MCF6136251.1 Cof-type HAD-IIB family hydrolase [Pseudalkalibacillus berkeleyi]
MKLIAIDMDGTLVNNNTTINEENVQAIKQAQEVGIHVVVATGRAYNEAVNPIREAGLNLPIIAINGAQFRSTEGEIKNSITLSKETYYRVDELLDHYSMYYELYTNKGTYSNDPQMAIDIIVDIIKSANPEVTEEHAHRLAEYRVNNGSIHSVDEYHSIVEDPEVEIYKLLSFSRNEKNRSNALNDFLTFNDLAVSRSAEANIEITHRDAQKGIAVKNYADELGIPMSEVMAIGDNYNDVSMFELAGYSVAMGNAEEDIKKLCSFTTKTNDESGVAHAIQTFMRKNKVIQS